MSEKIENLRLGKNCGDFYKNVFFVCFLCFSFFPKTKRNPRKIFSKIKKCWCKIYGITFVLFKNVFYITEVCYLKKYFLPLKNFLYETKAYNKKITAIMKKYSQKIIIEKLSVEL